MPTVRFPGKDSDVRIEHFYRELYGRGSTDMSEVRTRKRTRPVPFLLLSFEAPKPLKRPSFKVFRGKRTEMDAVPFPL